MSLIYCFLVKVTPPPPPGCDSQDVANLYKAPTSVFILLISTVPATMCIFLFLFLLYNNNSTKKNKNPVIVVDIHVQQ